MELKLSSPMVITPLGETKDSLSKIKAGLSQTGELSPSFYKEMRNSLASPPSFNADETVILSHYLYEGVTKNLDRINTPVVIANSKGGMRSFEKASFAFHTGEEFSSLFFEMPIYSASTSLIKHYKIEAPVYSIQSACASGLSALFSAARLLTHSNFERAIVLSVECSFCTLIEEGFSRMGVISKSNIMKPFTDERDGFKISEGGSAVILSKEDKDVVGILYSMAEGMEVEGLLKYTEDGKSIASVLKRLNTKECDFICAHATATDNDLVEDKAIYNVYKDTPVSGLKAYIGHLLGGSALTESLIALLLARDGYIAPFIGEDTKGVFKSNILRKPKSISKKDFSFVKTAYGFGGSITAACFGGL